MNPPNKNNISLPAAIMIAGTIIALALIWTHLPNTGKTVDETPGPQQTATTAMATVSINDHILGNPAAPIKLVEYSDPSCPYCQIFNPIMTQIMDEYGPTGKVAWVYRQFPLDKPMANGQVLHPNAGREATAFECAATLGGNTAFFAYEKNWFANFPSDGADRTAAADQAQIDQTAATIGLDKATFDTCLSSGRFDSKLNRSYQDGLDAGITGTPYTVIITPSGTHLPIAGAISYTTLKNTIEALLPTINTTATSTAS